MTLRFIESSSEYSKQFLPFVDSLLELIFSSIYQSNKNHILVDIGANKGQVTEIMLKHIDQSASSVIAIDAHPNWMEIFHLKKSNLITVNKACYSSQKEKVFVDTDECSGHGFFGLPPMLKNSFLLKRKTQRYILSCDTLDNIIDHNDKTVSFIKVDAESSDFAILLGAEKTIAQHRPFILFEFCGTIMEKAHRHTKKDFFNFFNLHQYSLFSVIQGHNTEYIFSNWNKNIQDLRDILAIPNEHLDNIIRKNYEQTTI